MIDPSSMWLHAVTIPAGAGAVIGSELGARRDGRRAQILGAFLVSVTAPPLVAMCLGVRLPSALLGSFSGGLTGAVAGALLIRFTRLRSEGLSLVLGVAALLGSYLPLLFL